MGHKELPKYGIGAALADVILLIELIVDICTGQLTWKGLLMLVLFSVLSGILVFSLIKRHRRKT